MTIIPTTVSKNPLEEMEWPSYSTKELTLVQPKKYRMLLGCSLKNDRMISVCFQGKPFNITVIQIYAPTTGAKEAEFD